MSIYVKDESDLNGVDFQRLILCAIQVAGFSQGLPDLPFIKL